MKPKAVEFQREHELFRTELINLVDQRHCLVKLAGTIDWDAAAERFGALYATSVGRPGVPIRLMVGLHYLKHAFNLADEMVVAQWVENPYWQLFCGEQYRRGSLKRTPWIWYFSPNQGVSYAISTKASFYPRVSSRGDQAGARRRLRS